MPIDDILKWRQPF